MENYRWYSRYKKQPKVLHVSSRGIGEVNEEGYIESFALMSFEVLSDPYFCEAMLGEKIPWCEQPTHSKADEMGF